MNKFLLLFSIFCFLPEEGVSQTEKDALEMLEDTSKPDSLELSSEPLSGFTFKSEIAGLHAGAGSFFYVTEKSGTITRLSFDGAEPLVFSPGSQIKSSAVHTFNPLRIFVYYREQQRCLWLNRFMTQIKDNELRFEELVYASEVCPAYENTLWVYDDLNIRLLRFDPLTGQIRQEIFLNSLVEEIESLTEYGHHLYAYAPEKGLLVWDTMGNYLKTLPLSQSHFNFFENELYFRNKNHLIMMKLYEPGLRKVRVSEKVIKADFLMIAPGKLILAYGNRLEVFECDSL